MAELLEKQTKQELISAVINLHSEVENMSLKNTNLNMEIEILKLQIKALKNQIFGIKSEKHTTIYPGQQTLDFGEKIDLDLPHDTEEISVSYHRKKPKKTREDFSKISLPEDLERVTTVIEPQEDTSDMEKIGEEVTELLAIEPQKFYVKRIVRPKYAKKDKSGIVVAELPSRIIMGGKVDVSLLVTILLDKYVDHMPLYRQVKKYERLGMKLNDSTIGFWVSGTLKILEYLYEVLEDKVIGSSYLQADETTIKVLDKLKKGTSHLGYYWVYHAVETGLIVYNYNRSRGKTEPHNFLSDYNGYLQTDGYAVYETLPNSNIQHLCCMAHARRNFFEAQGNDKARSTWILDKLQDLYAIESFARTMKITNDARFELRKKESVPVLNDMKDWLLKNVVEVLPQSAIGKSITYMLTRWEKLTLYTQNGILEIDNNLVENAMRPVALGRKNYLFAGSHDAAKRAGIIYSFIACCKNNGYNPYAWLEDTLIKLPDTKKSELHKLLPIKKQDGVY
jgi:transposase